jgi:paraquat-inducible protein B
MVALPPAFGIRAAMRGESVVRREVGLSRHLLRVSADAGRGAPPTRGAGAARTVGARQTLPKGDLVPATKQAPAAKKPATTRDGSRGKRALDGLEVSLDDAQQAVAELRRDLSTGGRRLLKDVETAVRSARRDLKRSRKAIQSDLGELGGALTPRRRTAPAAKKPARSGRGTQASQG